MISYQDFEEINKSLPEGDTYQNPRNLASGSIRQFDPKKCAERHVHFKAFTFVNALDFNGSYDASLRLLKEWGFDPVEYRIVSPENVIKAVAQFEQQIEENPYPSDGLVLALDDLEYGESLGMTGKFPRNAIAFKWQDETAETVLRNVEWSASRTGLINPVARSLIRYSLRGQMYPGQACTISDTCRIYSSALATLFPSTRQTRSFPSWMKT